METRATECFDVVLSPDGDGFYSVRDGLLSRYQIDPFKKTTSVPIDFRDMTPDPRISIGGGYRLDMLQPLTEFSHVVFGSENDDVLMGQGKSTGCMAGRLPSAKTKNTGWLHK